MIFDTHVHYDDSAFDEDRKELISSLPENGIEGFVNVCADYASIDSVLAIAKKYDYAYAALGIHPSDVEEMDEKKLEHIEKLIKKKSSKVVAVGEIGLDYHYPEPARDIQKKWFVAQIELALRVNKPVIIHSRDAAEDTQFTLDRYDFRELGGIVHCFSYSAALALHYAKRGFYIGIGGVITFKNARKLKEVVTMVPLESIVLETDCPYLAPEPYRGQRNSSLYLPWIVRTVANLKGVSEDVVEQVTTENAKRLYRIS